MGADLTFNLAGIFGATGPTGIHLAAAFKGARIKVRANSRSEAHLAAAFPGKSVDKCVADAADLRAAEAAVDGCDLVFDCIGLPGDAMHLHGVTAGNVARAARTAAARCVHVSSYWGYLPQVREVIDESHPRSGGSAWMQARRAAEDAMLAEGAAVLHLPDFYGPHVRIGPMTEALRAAAAGRTIDWIGKTDVAREYVYVPDAMKVAVKLACRADAYGERWALPGSGPITGREVADIAGEHLGRRVKLRAAGPLLLRLVALFNRDLRGFLQMVPEYLKPVRYDTSRLEGLIGRQTATPYTDAIAATLDWLKGAGA